MVPEVIISGPPKAGNHALLKACELLGLPVEVEHREYAEGLPVGVPHVFIKRDPRNILISMLRFRQQSVTPGTFITQFRRYDTYRVSFSAFMGRFASWQRHPRTLTIRYEDLVASDATMRQIAAFVETPYLDGAFEELPGLTKTWNAVKSDYHTIWTPDVERVWMAEGGPALLKEWGYA